MTQSCTICTEPWSPTAGESCFGNPLLDQLAWTMPIYLPMTAAGRARMWHLEYRNKNTPVTPAVQEPESELSADALLASVSATSDQADLEFDQMGVEDHDDEDLPCTSAGMDHDLSTLLTGWEPSMYGSAQYGILE